MLNTILVNETSLSRRSSLSREAIAQQGGTLSAETLKAAGRKRAPGKPAAGQMFNRSLWGGLLDFKSSSLPLTVLAQAAASSGKRLVVEIHDEAPVKIVHSSMKGV
jgi:hypothetical protein